MAPIRKQLWRLLLLAMIGVALLLICGPLLTAAGIRGWIWWATRGQKLTCQIDGIDAALFRPVTLRGLHLTGNAEVRIDITAPRVIVGLNLGSVFRMRGHPIRSLVAENVHGQIHRNESKPFFSRSAWSSLRRLLPDSFKLTEVDLQIEQGDTSVSLRGLTATGSAIENGQLQIREASIASPHLRRDFTWLRGATNWHDDRLTMSALTLDRGLDINSVTVDLSELDQERLGLEADVDAFHGKIRANISNDWASQPSNWDAAGSATDVSLEQTLQALGFTDQVHGLLHACKFTFRGNFHDPKHATASLWTELTRLSWRRRAAEVIMIGASLYNQQIQLQQLYVKQSANQLNASGEAVFPAGNFDWFNPNFSGNISASITDLGAFANLFGAEPGDFSGQIAVEGTINASDRKFGGHLAATGGALVLFKAPFESLGAKLSLTSKAFQIEQLELHRQKDFVRAEGTVELAGEHIYSGKATIAAAKLADYAGLLPSAWRGVVTDGKIQADWSGQGKTGSHAGSFHLYGTGLRTGEAATLLPINAELEAEYSPGNIFFRQARLANGHASLNGFVTLSSGYTQIQGIAFDLNAKPILRGNVFLPASASQLLAGVLLAGGADAEQKADLDLDVEPVDLHELSSALFTRGGASGKFATRLSIFGALNALQGWADFHGRDISMPNDSARFAFDGDARFVSGTMQTKATLLFNGSDPIVAEGNIPVFAREHGAPDEKSFAVNLNFPAVFLARLPRFMTHDTFRDGIVSGKLSMVGPRMRPSVSGDLQLTNGKLNPARSHFSDVSARMIFRGHEASIEFFNISEGNLALILHGTAGFDDLNSISVQLSAPGPLTILGPQTDSQCVNEIRVAPITLASVATTTDAIGVVGSVLKNSWSLTIPSHPSPTDTPKPAGVAPVKRLPICLDKTANGTSLVIGVEPLAPPSPEKARSRKKSRRH